MIVFPNCKINLGLRILRKRSDGYHDIETFFYPVSLADALEIIPDSSPQGASAFSFSVSGAEIQGRASDNLCLKAAELLKADFPEIPRVKIHLHKTIPTGAGLGGGSADAAFTLLLLNKLFNLAITQEQLLKYATQIGSDCPFFIINKPCFATGRGEILEEMDITLSEYIIAIANPGIHIDTKLAFGNIVPVIPGKSIKEIIKLPPEQWRNEMINDFEETISQQYPEIADIKKYLYTKGAVYAAMSGSGSTVFGLFKKEKVPQLSFPAGYFVKLLPG